MKVLVILGRGIEGCGVTKYTLEQINYFKKKNIKFNVFASSDKNWTRKKSHNINDINLIKLKNDDEINNFLTLSESFDFLIINSLPPIKSQKEVIDGFDKIIDKINIPIVLIQHDHSSLSIKRNGCLDNSINAADVIFSHSPTNDFSKYVNKLRNTTKLFGENNFIKINNFQPGFDFDEVRKKYWKDINIQKNNVHRWIGRTTPWKGYDEFMNFFELYLKKNNIIAIMNGIEKSPAFIVFKETYNYNDCFNKNSKVVTDKVNVHGPFNYEEMMEEMSISTFGYQLSRLKPEFIEHSIEYTHCDIAAAGVVPIFRKSYGDNCIHTKTGNPLSEDKNSGIIWLNDYNIRDNDKNLNLMINLANDNVFRDEMREMSFEYLKSHQNYLSIFDDLFNTIKLNLK